jgi:glycerol-3-phosphate dehydrogenase
MIATCFGNSRNKYFGKLVGGGMTPTEAYEQLKIEKKHAEGFETLK